MAHSPPIPNPAQLAGAATAQTQVGASRNAPAWARRFTRDVLTGCGADGELLERAELLVSELVTNVVVHAGTAARLSVSVTDGVARIEVEDRGPGRVARRQPANLRSGNAGYGLWLVDSLAESWGVEYGEGRPGEHGVQGRQQAGRPKTVWLTLALPA